MTSINEMLQELDLESGTTRRVLERVDGEQLGRRPGHYSARSTAASSERARSSAR